MHKNGILKSLVCACFALVFTAVAPIDRCFHASGQALSNGPSFEVATVKPVDPSFRFDGKRFWAHVNPAGASYWYMTTNNLISYAYDVESFQIAGPEWTKADHFDIEGRFSTESDKKDDRKMLQALLRDRFKLAFHIEKKPLDGYALVVGRHGEKLIPSLPDSASTKESAPSQQGNSKVGNDAARSRVTKNQDGSSTVDLGRSGTQTVKFDKEIWAMHYEVSKMTMEELAGRLSNCLGAGVHKIVDETGVRGTFQLAWDCPSSASRPSTSVDAAGALPSDPQDGSALTRSLDALGLKLEKRKFLQDVYVIDHVERPSEN